MRITSVVQIRLTKLSTRSVEKDPTNKIDGEVKLQKFAVSNRK